MKQERIILGSYFRHHAFGIALYGFTNLIFWILFFLYHLPREVVLYGTLLSFYLVILLGVIFYLPYRNKVKELQKLKHSITLGTTHLPQAWNEDEHIYQELLTILFDDREIRLHEIRQQRQSMAEYFTMWVHQIKTPIAAMQLLVGELEDDYERQQELKAELFQINQYTDMVLQYIRLHGRGNDFFFRTYDLDKIVKQAVRKLSTIFIRKKLKLVYEPLNVKVVSDEKWLTFVLEQILSNALKYTTVGQISIYLERGRKQVLVIEDSGIGIFPEDLPRIFEQGYTGYNGRKDKKATGIGLYLCKGILDKLSHRIWLESLPGHGTRVFIDLG